MEFEREERRGEEGRDSPTEGSSLSPGSTEGQHPRGTLPLSPPACRTGPSSACCRTLSERASEGEKETEGGTEREREVEGERGEREVRDRDS